jgi:hypothetical protein
MVLNRSVLSAWGGELLSRTVYQNSSKLLSLIVDCVAEFLLDLVNGVDLA